MKIELLTPIENLKSQLLVIELAGRTCYQSFKGAITDDTARKFIKMILGQGHESVIEHSLMTVRFSGVSRGFTHEMVRHRLCAFSQESTRYVDERGFDMILPPGRDETDVVLPALQPRYVVDWTVGDIVEMYQTVYERLRSSGWKAEDARQFLPIGMTNEIVVSANFREWRHIFRMRTQKAAHWEIRRVMCELLEMVQVPLSPIFDDFARIGKDAKGVPYYDEVWRP